MAGYIDLDPCMCLGICQFNFYLSFSVFIDQHFSIGKLVNGKSIAFAVSCGNAYVPEQKGGCGCIMHAVSSVLGGEEIFYYILAERSPSGLKGIFVIFFEIFLKLGTAVEHSLIASVVIDHIRFFDNVVKNRYEILRNQCVSAECKFGISDHSGIVRFILLCFV